MDAPQNGAIIDCVHKMVASLDAVGASLRDVATRARPDDTEQDEDTEGNGLQSAVKNVEDNAKRLHSMINDVGSQRVLMLSSDQLMEAGIVLYNAARAAFKSFQSTLTGDELRTTYSARFPILFVRFMAARVMGLALSCSKGGPKNLSEDRTQDQSVFVDDCLDVLRSYGRVGSLLLETAAMDKDKCYEYLTLAKEALEYASTIWGQVGLSCLTRFKDGIELEEILQDLWDFCVDRIRAVRLLQSFAKDSTAVTTIIETLHELQMLLPYMVGNTKCILELVQDALDEWAARNCHSDLVVLAEEALRLCDAVESSDEMVDEGFVSAFKRCYLERLLCSLVAQGDVEKAEACFALLGPDKAASTILAMMKLYLNHQEGEKARTMLKYLSQRDDVAASIAGARMFVEANAFSEESIQVYRRLERHYGDHVLEIGLDLACTLATSESAQNRAQAISELKRVIEMAAELSRERRASVQTELVRVRRTIHDAAGLALRSNAHEESAAWAELGIQQAASPQEAAVFKRILAAAYLKMNRHADSRRWAKEAFEMDHSKASMLSIFEASLDSDKDEASAIGLIRQVRERDDFEPQDLVPYGYAANSVGREDLTLVIMEELCCILSAGGTVIKELPFGVLLLNTAQLALRVATARGGEPSEAPTSYASNFVKFADMFLQAGERLSVSEINDFASESSFVWFYTMSFNVARNCNVASLFIRAASFAKIAHKFFGADCVIASRELECLLAALSSEMMSFESIDHARLAEVLGIVERIKPFCGSLSEHDDFLVKCELAIRLRMHDTDVELMRSLCQEKMGKSVSNFTEVGELILQASRFDEATGIRQLYRALASDMFKRSLQLLLQGDTIDQATLSYLFRRLITLAMSRDDAFEWFEQLLQLDASVDIEFPEMDAEWFISKAWNMGVQCHRSQSYADSHKFMKMALALLANVGASLNVLANDLHQQYQELSSLGSENILPVD